MPFTCMYCGWLNTCLMQWSIVRVQCASSLSGGGVWLHHMIAHLMYFAKRACFSDDSK